MARHIRVPGIVDVVLVSDPAEIRALNDHAKIDRNFIPRGPIINRLIVGRIRRFLRLLLKVGAFLQNSGRGCRENDTSHLVALAQAPTSG